jgi:hypothetical protein
LQQLHLNITFDSQITLQNLQDDIDNHGQPNCYRISEPSDYPRLSQFGHFTVLAVNIRSLYCNLDRFLVFVSCFNITIDILVLSECWTSETRVPPSITDYNLYHTKTQLNKNDGVVVYVHSKHSVQAREPVVIEGNCLVLNVNKAYTLVCSYRPPCYGNPSAYLDSLDSILSNIHTPNVLFVGDININILPGQVTSQGAKYLTLMLYYGLLQGVDKPTAGPNSCIDHFMVKCNKTWTTYVFDHLTDHCPVLLTVSDATCPKSPESNHIKKHDYNNIRERLALENWSQYYNLCDTNIAAEALVNKIRTAIDLNTYTVTVPKKRKPLKPWITEGVVRSIRKRNKLQRKSNQAPNDTLLRNQYCSYRNICNKLVKTLKKEYYQSELQKYHGDIKNTWKVIKDVCNLRTNRNHAEDLLEIGQNETDSLNIVNRYFTSIGKTLADIALANLKSTDTQLASKKSSVSGATTCSFFLYPTDSIETLATILSLKSGSAPGEDGITSDLLKLCRLSIVDPITYLCNLCFSTGVFPDIFKRAKITPVFKNGNKKLPSNYRPIALISVISKIIEKLVNKRLKKYLEVNSLLGSNQYGFRAKTSTEDAVIHLTTSITEHLDAGKKCLGVFLDLQKAFDTVSIPILLARLENVGIRGIALQFFTDYLTGRMQCTSINKINSEWIPIEYGVPQGSTLAPTLFLIYVNDLCKTNIPGCKTLMFADDTVLLFNDGSWDRVRILAENGIGLVTAWLEDSLLSLNVTKTNYICFSKTEATKPREDFKVAVHTYPCNRYMAGNCNCALLTRADHVKYLGVQIDAHLNWTPHITVVASRIRKLLYAFRNLRDVASKPLLIQTYKALGECIVNYCIGSWGGAAKTHMIELERAQRALLKVILRLPFRFATAELYRISLVPSVRKLYILQCLKRYHRKVVPTLPASNKRIDRCPLPAYKTKFARRNINYCAPLIYNKIKLDYTDLKTLSNYTFKKTVWTWLSDKSYDETENLVRLGYFGS